jgi:hypothetical protein
MLRERNGLALIGAIGLTALGCAQSGGSSSAQPRSHHDIVIQFGDMSIQPAVAHAKAGGSVAFDSLATSYQGVVSFPDSVVPHFTCKELRPDFFPSGNGRLQSIPVSNAGENLVLPCPLEPGSYEYRVDLFQGPEGMGVPGIGMGDPMRSLHGKLIVE